MPDRPYSDMTIDQLERLVRENREKPAILGPIRVELEYRTTPRAKQLLKEVLALVEGDIPKPKPPRAGRPEHQESLFTPPSEDEEN
jgi:hypothetical protein